MEGSRQAVGFREVKAEILDRIRTKTWPPGTLLPSELDLAAEFRCARATVNRAMRELAESGIIDRKRKAGSRVSETPVRQATLGIQRIRDEVERAGAAYRYALVSRAVQAAPDWLVARLELAPGARAVHLECMHYADSSPFLFEERWISIEAVPAAEEADFAALSPNEWLVREMPFTNAEFTMYASGADDKLVAFLSVAPGEPIFTVERTTWIGAQSITFARLFYGRGYRLTTRT